MPAGIAGGLRYGTFTVAPLIVTVAVFDEMTQLGLVAEVMAHAPELTLTSLPPLAEPLAHSAARAGLERHMAMKAKAAMNPKAAAEPPEEASLFRRIERAD